MDWLNTILAELEREEQWSYTPAGLAAAEPAAWAAMALAAHDRHEAACRAATQLSQLQNENGSLGIDKRQNSPHWPTALATLAWITVNKATNGKFQKEIDLAIPWLLNSRGKKVNRTDDLGHNTELIGWAWVEGTHSWLEPTAFAVLALNATGNSQNPRTIEAVQLLIDRLLPEGGANYGNTYVLGQELRPHIEPSGMALLALASASDPSGRLARTLEYVAQTADERTSAASLGYALLGLAAWQRTPQDADAWMAAAAKRTLQRPGSQPRLALLAQAARGTDAPLVQLARKGVLQ